MDRDLLFQCLLSKNQQTKVKEEWLKNLEQENPDQWLKFDFTPDKQKCQSELKIELFKALVPDILSVFSSVSPESLYQTLWEFWLPLALWLAASQKELRRPLIQGILGGQGTGKTTLGAVLKLILAKLGYTSASLSLDDLYKTYRDRQILKAQDPRFVRRGPPGTHEVELGIEVLQRCRNAQYPVEFPRFDKSAYGGEGDRTKPEIITDADIVFFEGWFVGVQPIYPDQFASAPAPIHTEADRNFAQEINQRLYEYLPLWKCLDQLIILSPIDYRWSKQWRWEAEQERMATGKGGMSASEISDFVDYFWRSLHPELFIIPLTQNSELTDLVVEINRDHSVGRIYQPRGEGGHLK